MYLYEDYPAGYGYKFPDEFLALCSDGLPEIDPWWWLVEYEPRARFWMDTLNHQRHPNYYLLPFAKDGGSDDVACFVQNNPGVVQIIHGFCDPGFQNRGSYTTFAAWLEEALEFTKGFRGEGYHLRVPNWAAPFSLLGTNKGRSRGGKSGPTKVT